MKLHSLAAARPTRLVLFTSLVLALLTFSACGPASSSQSNLVLTISTGATGDFTDNFNPFVGGVGGTGLIYEPLLFINRNRQSDPPQGWLASQYTFSPDAKSLTFTLRNGVTWSDGQPFTSDDVVFTLNLLKQFPGLDTKGLWKYLSSVTAPDAKTVTVTLSKPYSPLLWNLGVLTNIVPKHIWSSVGDPVKFANTSPIGTGPYTLKSFTAQLYVMDRNPHYWQPGKPAAQEVRYPSYKSATDAILAMTSGQNDWAGNFAQNVDSTFVARDSAHNSYYFPPQSLITLTVNTAKFPFNTLAVRQAVAVALDRDQASKVGEYGYELAASPTGLILPNNQKYLDPQYANLTFSADVTKATQILEAAGFKKGSDGIYVSKDGKRLSFGIDVISTFADQVADSQVFVTNLKAAGMDASVNLIASAAFTSSIKLGNFDSAVQITRGGPTPFFLYDALLDSQFTAPIDTSAISNVGRWQDPATDALLTQYATSTDPTVQQTAIAGLEKIMVDQVPFIPLIYGNSWAEFSTAKVTNWPSANNPYALPAPFVFPDALVVLTNVTAA